MRIALASIQLKASEAGVAPVAIEQLLADFDDMAVGVAD